MRASARFFRVPPAWIGRERRKANSVASVARAVIVLLGYVRKFRPRSSANRVPRNIGRVWRDFTRESVAKIRNLEGETEISVTLTDLRTEAVFSYGSSNPQRPQAR